MNHGQRPLRQLAPPRASSLQRRITLDCHRDHLPQPQWIKVAKQACSHTRFMTRFTSSSLYKHEMHASQS